MSSMSSIGAGSILWIDPADALVAVVGGVHSVWQPDLAEFTRDLAP